MTPGIDPHDSTEPPPSASPANPYAMNDALEALVGQGWNVSSRRGGRARLQRRWQAVALTVVPPGRVESRPVVSNWTLAAILTAAAVAAATCWALLT